MYVQYSNRFFVNLIFRSPARLVDLSVILYMDKNQGHNCGDDMALFRLYVSIFIYAFMQIERNTNFIMEIYF